MFFFSNIWLNLELVLGIMRKTAKFWGARMAYAVSSPLISEVKPGRLGL